MIAPDNEEETTVVDAIPIPVTEAEAAWTAVMRRRRDTRPLGSAARRVVLRGAIAAAMLVGGCVDAELDHPTLGMPPARADVVGPADGYTCPQAFDASGLTACVYGEAYDSPSVADVCEHLPASMAPSGDDPCSYACDWDLVHAYAVRHAISTFTFYECESTDGFLFFVGIRP